MGSKTFDGVWFISYSKDHEPPHIHGQYGETIVIVDLKADGTISRSVRLDSVQPSNAKRADVRRILKVAAAHALNYIKSGRQLMVTQGNGIISDEQIDEALERAREFDCYPRIVEAVFRPEPELDLFLLKLDNGRRIVLPREELSELRDATKGQAADFVLGRHGRHLWWPQLDDGIYLPNLLRDLDQSTKPNAQNEVAA